VQAHRERSRARGDRDALVELTEVLGDRLAEPTLVALIARAARSDWRAAAALLAMRWPERWGVPSLRTSVGDSDDLDNLDREASF
jgi:hypothetical protein